MRQASIMQVNFKNSAASTRHHPSAALVSPHQRLAWSSLSTRHYEATHGDALCRCFELPTSKFVFARLARMVCSEDMRFILV